MEPSQIVNTLVSIMNTALLSERDGEKKSVIIRKTISALEPLKAPGREIVIGYLKDIYQNRM